MSGHVPDVRGVELVAGGEQMGGGVHAAVRWRWRRDAPPSTGNTRPRAPAAVER